MLEKVFRPTMKKATAEFMILLCKNSCFIKHLPLFDNTVFLVLIYFRKSPVSFALNVLRSHKTSTGKPKGKSLLLGHHVAASILFIYALINDTFNGS